MRVLIVEDQALIGLALAQVLNDAGHQVIGPASTSTDAIRLIRSEKPELAFVDVDLEADGVGLELARYLSDDCRCPVILTTGRHDLARRCESAIALLKKPYDFAEAVLAIEASGWILRGEQPPTGCMPSSLEPLKPLAHRPAIESRPVLLVEDHLDDVEIALAALQRCDIANSVVVARDGAEAVEYLESHPDQQPAVILLDIKMPKMTGIEVLTRIRRRSEHCAIPVVMLTASNLESDRRMCRELGANDYIVKPRSFQGLAEELNKVSSYCRAMT